MELALENPQVAMPKITNEKKEVVKKLKEKLEQAKLNLIYVELEELGINVEKNYTSVAELDKDLKKTCAEVDYNKVTGIIEKVNNQLESVVNSLEQGSTNAFTKLMTSDLAKSIGKTLGFTLAARTALVLAPTATSKAVVASGLGVYSLYKIIKNRKEIQNVNEDNELNNILTELETTKDNDAILDTRFDEETQKEIREFLNKYDISFEDTGYRSLRQAIYTLEPEKKKMLVNALNSKLGRGIDVDERVKKARKKLNVVASTAATVGVGAKLGMDVASAVNGVDPGLVSGLINGSVLGAWVQNQAGKPWFSALSGGLGFAGTEVLERLPVIGNFAHTLFAGENIAALAAIGATGGLVTSAVLGVASGVKQIVKSNKAKKETDKFLKLDAEKYKEEDEKELLLIKEKLKESDNTIELVIIDIIVNYLRDKNIVINPVPKSVEELKTSIEKLSDEEKKEAKIILTRIEDSLNNDTFKDKLLKAGKISIGLFTAGLSLMSVYDIIKGGVFLPELSKQLFPENNIYNPVPIPDGPDVPLTPDNSAEYSNANNLMEEFKNNDNYYHEYTGSNYLMDTAQDVANEAGRKEGEGFFSWLFRQIGLSFRLNGAADFAFADNLVDKAAEGVGIDIVNSLTPDRVAITNALNSLSPDKLLLFMRYMNTNTATDGMTTTIREMLQQEAFVGKVTDYINNFTKIQANHEFINDITRKFATGLIPASVFYTMIEKAQKNTTDEKYTINENEITDEKESDSLSM